MIDDSMTSFAEPMDKSCVPSDSIKTAITVVQSVVVNIGDVHILTV